MARLQAKKIAAALIKAQHVGEVEEMFNLHGCNVVLRSLTNGEYESATAAVADLEDVSFVIGFRVEHLCRSIIEFNGVSMREYDFVEVDVQDPKTETTETITLERHTFVRDYILASWSREAVDVAFRKFGDLVLKAEKAASEGIHFETKEESSEETYRRLMAEIKEIEGSVPFELAAKIRDEHGYLLKQEWASTEDKLAALSEQTVPEVETPVAPVAQAPVQPPAPPVQQSTDVIMRRSPAAPSTLSVPVMPPMGAPVAVAAAKRSAEIEEMENLTGLDQGEVGSSIENAFDPRSTVLERRPLVRDPDVVNRVIDQPPAGGINPRFKKRT